MKIRLILPILLLTAWPAYAETIVLKTGSVITGSIIEKDARKIKVDVSGVALTYYLDDIKSINGVDAAAPVAAAPATPVPAITPTSTTVPTNNKPAVVTSPATTPQLTSKSSALAGMSKKELILKFIDLFGTRESLNRNLAELVKRSPPQQAEAFKKAVNVDELIEQLIPIYDKYFSEDDLKSYIEFYSSSQGKKLLETVPHIMEDSIGVSMKYFKEKLPANLSK